MCSVYETGRECYCATQSPFWRHVKTTQFSYTLHTYATSQQAYFHGVLPRRTHCFNSAGLTECGTPTRIFLTVWKKSKDLFWRALICFGNTCLFLQLLLSSPLEPFVVCFCRIKCSDRSCKGAAMRGREGYNLPTVSDFFFLFLIEKRKQTFFFFFKKEKKKLPLRRLLPCSETLQGGLTWIM